MPITCPITFPRLTTEAFGTLDYEIMKLAFASHKELGRLADETVYQADFVSRLVAAGYEVHREVPISVTFRHFVKIYYMDVVVNGKAIYELKTVSKLTAEHAAQVLNYMLLVDCGHGKLINFRPGSVDSRFVNAPLTLAQRRDFSVDDLHWQGDAIMKDWLVDVVRDWGTSLELPLYYQAMIHLLGGDERVAKLLPLRRGDIELGNQRFHLLKPDEAFRITAFGVIATGYAAHVKRLLKHSPLKAMHWINIGHEEVTFTTIS